MQVLTFSNTGMTSRTTAPGAPRRDATRRHSLIRLVSLFRLTHDTGRAAPLSRMLTRAGEVAETSLGILFIEGGSRTRRASGSLRGRSGLTCRLVERSV